MTTQLDAIDLLLPDAPVARRADVRRVAHFLRLLVDDAHAAHARSLGVDLMRARRELESEGRERVLRALRELVREHLDAAIPPESALFVGESSGSAHEAWTQLLELRAQEHDLPELPRPGEPVLAVAQRLLDVFERFGASAAEIGLWRARWTRLAHGVRAGEAAFQAVLQAAIAAGDLDLRRSSVAGLAECLLDRGAVREVRHLLREELGRSPTSARLRVLFAWASACVHDEAAARAALQGLRPWSGPIPTALVELRDRLSAWVPLMPGRARGEGSVSASGPRTAVSGTDRSSFGGSLLAVFVYRRNHGARCLHADVAAALRTRVPAWLADQESAVATPGSLPHRVVVRARAACEHRDERPLAGALSEASCAAFVEPILDEHGEVAGWVHGELEHHLMPSEDRRRLLAAAWRETVLNRAAAASLDDPPSPVARGLDGTSSPSNELLQRTCETIVDALALKTAQRRWWAFDATTAEPLACAAGGDGAELERFEPGRRKGLERALGAAAPVLFDEPDERLAVHARAASGLVLLLRFASRTCGLLAIESARRHDFDAADVERLQRGAARAALGFRIAQFRAWHVERFGHDVWFDDRGADFARYAERLVLAGRSHATPVLRGPAGVGKEVLARWMHFESPRASEEYRVLSLASTRTLEQWEAELGRLDGTTCVEDLDAAPSAVQELLLAHLDRRSARASHDGTRSPRWILTTKRPLADDAAAGRIRPELARRLERLELAVPTLRERREEVLPLVECFARRFAREEGVRAPAFDESGLALLWRQDWPGHVRELENFIYKVVLAKRSADLADVERIGEEHLLRLAEDHGLKFIKKVPSRHPRREDLLAAMRIARTQGGRLNKTKASVYLGWDPDTVVVRFGLAGIVDAKECDGAVWITDDPGASTEEAGSGSDVPAVGTADDRDDRMRELPHDGRDGKDGASSRDS